MTREESLIQLKEFESYFQDRIEKETDVRFDKEQAKKDLEAIKMTIKALEQEPCGDCISRKHLQDKYKTCADMLHEDAAIVMEWVNDAPPVQPKNTEYEDCVSLIKLKEQMLKYGFCAPDMTVTEFVEDILPSIQPKQKVGQWIGDAIQGEIDGQIVKGFTCSKCGAISLFRMTGGKIVNGDLCPNCEAKMEMKENG